MPEMHLREPGLMYSACEPVQKLDNNTKIQYNRILQVYL